MASNEAGDAAAAAAAACVLADVQVVHLLDALGISGNSAVSLIAMSPSDLTAVAAEVFGDDYSSADLDALSRVWHAARFPGQCELALLSRRLLPTSIVPPLPRLRGGTNVRGDASTPSPLPCPALPPDSSPATAALVATTRCMHNFANPASVTFYT